MSAPPPGACAAKRVLIVDDERDNRELLEIILAREGYDISTAASGAEALASVARQPPDLVLLDVMMPFMNGYEVATALKADAATRVIPIVMVTALSDANARARAHDAGANSLLGKPLDRAELCLRVKSCLKAHALA